MKDSKQITSGIVARCVAFLIDRKIGVSTSILGVLVMALVSLNKIPHSMLPNADIPRIYIQIDYPNQSGHHIETGVLAPLRQTLLPCMGLRDLESTASNEKGVINLEFEYGTSMQLAFIEVNEKIDQQWGNMPKHVSRPKVIKASATDIPVLYLNVAEKLTTTFETTDKDLFPVSPSFVELSRFARHVLKKRLEQLADVAIVDISGTVSDEALIIPNPDQLRSLGLNYQSLELALRSNHLEMGHIRVNQGVYQFAVNFESKIESKQDLKDVLLNVDGRTFKLGDLADVIIHPQKRNGLVVKDGQDIISMAIIKSSSAQMSNMKERVYETIEQFKKDYSYLKFSMSQDQSELLDYSIDNLFRSLCWGILFAVVVMFVFLKNWRVSLLIGITIPLCLLLTVLFFDIFSISINIVSLSGLILGVGMMVDNSIIVIDNIEYHLDHDCDLKTACTKGSSELWSPLLSSVLTTCSVFLPVIFVDGLTGILFYDQAISVSVGLLASLITAILVIPVYFVVGVQHLPNDMLRKVLKTTFIFNAFFESGLKHLLRKNQFLFWGILILLIGGGLSFQALNLRLLPQVKESSCVVKIDWVEQLKAEEGKRRVISLMNKLDQYFDHYIVHVGDQQYLMNTENNPWVTDLFVKYQPWIEEDEFKSALKKQLQAHYPTVKVTFESSRNVFNQLIVQKADLEARIRPTEQYHEKTYLTLNDYLVRESEKSNHFSVTSVPVEPYIDILFDTKKLLSHGLTYSLLRNKLQNLFNEKEIFYFNKSGDQLPVIIGNKGTSAIKKIESSFIRNQDGKLLPLHLFLTTQQKTRQKEIHADMDGVYYPFPYNVALDNIDQFLTNAQSRPHGNDDFITSLSGQYFENLEMARKLLLIFGVSIFLLYCILSIQFESLLIPFIILTELPIGISGAFIGLYLLGYSLDIMSMIGIVVMCGIVINDSILKIETIQSLRKAGFSPLGSLLRASRRRLRPIIMTSITTILALVPILLSSGLGAELQHSFAISLISGMVIGTLVSLYFVPVAYFWFDQIKWSR